jgi:hypothetical protein
MNEQLIRFYDGHELIGYGFDIIADRVVRFSKHQDGTYLNTRATYSINKKEFTHFQIRSMALKEKPINIISKKESKYSWKLIGFVVLAAVMLTNCTMNFSFDINSSVIENEISEDI